MPEHISDIEPDPEGQDDEFDLLILECLARMESEGDAALEALCAAQPSHANALRRRVRILREAGLVGAPGAGDEPFPSELGDFRLLRRLGGGGMGVVYAARQNSLDRVVALKLIRPESMYFPGARARFLREAQSIARLAHPAIVPVHTFGEASGVPYIAMELVAGVSLSSILARLADARPAELDGARLLELVARESELQPTDADRASMPFAQGWIEACVWIAREVAQALEHAHQRGVVHRDVKPSNVMLTTAGRVLLVDFGLASTAGTEAVTRTGSAVGSLPYMAPEQVRGDSDRIGPRTDIYSLGVLLYELIALERPHDGADAQALLAAILAGRPAPLRAHNASVSRDVAAVVSVAMSAEIERRYGSAADFARDLTHVLSHEPVEARPAGAWSQLTSWVKRHPAAATLAGTVFIGPLLLAAQQWRANERIRDEVARADTNFDHALDAVDTMLARVGDETLREVPQMEEVRRELLEQALQFYGRFLEAAGDSFEVRLRGARARQKVGRIRADLGHASEAESVLAEAEATLRELEREAPGDPGVSRALVAALQARANVLQDVGPLDRCEALEREILERSQAAALAHPSEAYRYRRILADTYQQLAFVLRNSNRREEALEPAQRAIDEFRAMAEERPDDVGALLELGEAVGHSAELMLGVRQPVSILERHLEAVEWVRRAHAAAPESPASSEKLGYALGAMGRFLSETYFGARFRPEGVSAVDTLEEAIEIYAELVAEFPRISRFEAALAAHSSNLCVHCARLGRFEEAEPHAERAMHAFERLALLEPAVPKRHSDLGAALNNLARLELQSGRPEQALALVDRALLEQQLAHDAQPDNPAFVSHLAQHHTSRCLALLELERWREAAEAARGVARAPTPGPLKYRSTAELLMQCAELATDEPAEGARLRDEAIETLRQGVEHGLKPEDLAERSAFASLREGPEFRSLLGEP